MTEGIREIQIRAHRPRGGSLNTNVNETGKRIGGEGLVVLFDVFIGGSGVNVTLCQVFEMSKFIETYGFGHATQGYIMWFTCQIL